MSKQSIAITVSALVIFVVILVLAFVRGPSGTVSLSGTEVEPSGPVTRESLARNVVIVVPGAGDESAEEGVAIPESISAVSAHRGDAVLRDFAVKIENDAFNPRELRAFVGDTVRITATAVDKDYTVRQPDYGFGATIRRGETGFITHQAGFEVAAADTFYIMCTSCRNPDDPAGVLVVVPR